MNSQNWRGNDHSVIGSSLLICGIIWEWKSNWWWCSRWRAWMVLVMMTTRKMMMRMIVVIGGDSHSMLVQSYLLRFFLLRQTMRTSLTSPRWWEWQQWWCWWLFCFWLRWKRFVLFQNLEILLSSKNLFGNAKTFVFDINPISLL